MKYLVNKVCVDGQGISIKETLEDAKNEWASIYIEVYETTDEQLAEIRVTCNNDYDKCYSYLKENCEMIYKK
jgi:hypothetical protein